MTRADAILAAIKAALSRHQVESPALRAVVIEVHVKAGAGHPRSVVIRPEYEEILEVTLFSNGDGVMRPAKDKPTETEWIQKPSALRSIVST